MTKEKMMILGYQWGANNAYIGTYEFPNNEDKDEIHLPPNTTLLPVPELAADEVAVWGGATWTITSKPEIEQVEVSHG